MHWTCGQPLPKLWQIKAKAEAKDRQKFEISKNELSKYQTSDRPNEKSIANILNRVGSEVGELGQGRGEGKRVRERGGSAALLSVGNSRNELWLMIGACLCLCLSFSLLLLLKRQPNDLIMIMLITLGFSYCTLPTPQGGTAIIITILMVTWLWLWLFHVNNSLDRWHFGG